MLFLVLWSVFLVLDVLVFERFLWDIDKQGLADFPHAFHTFVRASLFAMVVVYGVSVEISFAKLNVRRKRLALTVISGTVAAVHILTAIGIVAGRKWLIGYYGTMFTKREYATTAVSLQDRLQCCGWDLISVPAGAEYCSFTKTCHDALSEIDVWCNGINGLILILAAFIQCIIIGINLTVPELDVRVYTAI